MPNEIIIKFKAEVKPDNKEVVRFQKFGHASLDRLNREHDIQSIRLTGHKKQENTYLLKLNSNKLLQELINQYKQTDLFEYVEPNYIVRSHGTLLEPDDTFYNRQWQHFNDGDFSLATAIDDADMDTDLAWNITQGDPNLIVAILDTGAKLDHPELVDRIWSNAGEIGWDFVNDDNVPTDDNGHGTHVAGIALASGNNNLGYAGINWNSQIMVCKVLGSNGSGSNNFVAEGIYYAVDNGASIINLSLGNNIPATIMENAISYAYENNVTVIASSGNDNTSVAFPARYENVIAVGSTDPDDSRSVPFPGSNISGSNHGPELDVVAPGNYIFGLSHNSNTNFNLWYSGTSQAAPQVAGIISLILSIDNTLTVDEIKTIIQESAEDQLGSFEDTLGWDEFFGHGRVNAHKALQRVTLDVTSFNNDTFIIYPNSISNEAPLEVQNVEEGQYIINLHNLLGQRVHSQEIVVNSSKLTLTLPQLTSGTYFLKLNNTSVNTSVVKKIIIQ